MRAKNLKQRRSPEAYNRPEVYMSLVFKRCQMAKPSNLAFQGKFEVRNPNLLKKNFFSLLPGPVLNFRVTCWTPISVILEGLPIYRFRVILGRKIQICREKIFWTAPWASTGQYQSSTGPRSGPKQFFSANLKSTTQNYPKMIYWNNLSI